MPIQLVSQLLAPKNKENENGSENRKKAEDKRKEKCKNNFEDTLKRPRKNPIHYLLSRKHVRSQMINQQLGMLCVSETHGNYVVVRKDFNKLIKSMPVHRKVLGFVS